VEFDRTVIGSAWRSRPKALSLLVCSFALLSIAEVTCGAGEYLVQDLGQLIRFPPSDIGIPLSVVIDEVAYFFRNDGAHGHELWRSDGTPLGTYLMMDVCPGICGAESVGSSGARMTSVGSSLYFAANDGVHGTELWITDGTPVGTRMVADIWPGPESSGISAMGSAGGIVFFGANDGVHGPELWRSNGTASGTWLVAELTPGPYGEGLHSIDGVQGRIYVRGGNRIWASDGTSAGTTLLSENAAYSESSSSRGAAHRILPSGLLLFVGCQSEPTQQDCELWRSDGTSAGTMLLADLNPGPQSSNPQGFEPFGEEIWFTAIRQISPQASAWRLFRTDGSISGTVEVVLPGGVTPETHWSRAIGAMNRFYFTGIDADHGAEPWVTDGVTSTMLLDVRPGP
jgi:ELWxxDGT repeat protein